MACFLHRFFEAKALPTNHLARLVRVFVLRHGAWSKTSIEKLIYTLSSWKQPTVLGLADAIQRMYTAKDKDQAQAWIERFFSLY